MASAITNSSLQRVQMKEKEIVRRPSSFINCFLVGKFSGAEWILSESPFNLENH